MCRIATYTRANVPAPQPALVLERQQERLHDYVESRADSRVVAEFTDHASASDPKRPGLEDLLKQARAGAFDVVLVTSWDRLTRSPAEFGRLLASLKATGAQVWTPDHQESSPERLAELVSDALASHAVQGR
jgi:site-specific DNA recombinase